MVLSGHQPNYWPYPGLIGKIMKSDKFMFVTKVQFEKKVGRSEIVFVRKKDGRIFRFLQLQKEKWNKIFVML